jgi:hypothetical protein
VEENGTRRCRENGAWRKLLEKCANVLVLIGVCSR